MKTRLVRVVALLAVVCAAAARAEPVRRWDAPPDYKYTQLSICPQSYVRFQACDDQMALFIATAEQARQDKRKLLVIFGADWCPWCRVADASLPTAEFLGHAELAGKVALLKIALNVRHEGKRVIVPSGQAVQDLLAKRLLADQPQGYIPFYALIDPAQPGLGVGLSNGRFADVVNDKPVNLAPDFRKAILTASKALDASPKP